MNSRIILWLVVLIFFASSLIAVSCDKNSDTLSEKSQAQIYTAIIQKLYHDHNPTGTGYIMKYTDDRAGTGEKMLNSNLLSETLQQAILQELADFGATFVWVDKVSDISKVVISGAGSEIILGNIHLQEDGSTQVTASVYYGGDGGGGTTYILKLVDGAWMVTGNTGAIWIS